MPNELALTFEAMQVRMVIRDGDPWWVLADVCAPLETENVSQAAARLDADEKGISNIDTPGGVQEMIIISEPGLYKLLQTSRKPQAKRFDRWNRHDVLPQIRKTGFYLSPSIAPFAQLPDLFSKLDSFGQRLDEIHDNVKAITPRRADFPPNVQKQFLQADIKFYDGFCTCGCNTLIVENGEPIDGVYELDHWYGRHHVLASDGWPVAKDCNRKLDNTDFRKSKEQDFDAFQINLRRMLRRPPLKLFNEPSGPLSSDYRKQPKFL